MTFQRILCYCAFASEHYDSEEYIRDYEEYLQVMKGLNK